MIFRGSVKLPESAFKPICILDNGAVIGGRLTMNLEKAQKSAAELLKKYGRLGAKVYIEEFGLTLKAESEFTGVDSPPSYENL